MSVLIKSLRPIQLKLAKWMPILEPMQIEMAFDNTIFWHWCRLPGLPDTRAERRRASSACAWRVLDVLAQTVLAGTASGFDAVHTPTGRPVIRCGEMQFCASISHSRDTIAVALAARPDMLIGIDIEYRDPHRDIGGLSRWLFDKGPPDRDFYQAWCNYEANFKATGVTDPLMQPVCDMMPCLVGEDFAGAIAVYR
ncbi:MAG: hypothetical protein ABID63_17965 [Pseudomonadota bacterium]